MLTVYEDDRQRLYFKDKALEADFKLLSAKLPGRQIDFQSSSFDERLWIIRAYSDVEPGETYLFDRSTRALTLQYKIREALPRAALAPMKAIRYASSDGLEIPAYLTVPKGLPSKNLPLIVVPHGGPWGRDTWGYGGLTQFLANRGYAVLQPNFRASTGYGKKFLNAGNGQWGGKMQDDITWGVKHLVAQGNRGSEARRYHGRLVWRIRDARRRGVHARPLRGRRGHRRTVEPADAARHDPAVLGGDPHRSSIRAWGIRRRPTAGSNSSGSRRSTRPTGSRRRCSWSRVRTIPA